MAEGAEQVEARFAQVESGVERVLVLLALINARLLLCCGRKLGRRAGRVAGAVAQLQLRQNALQLLGGDLLLEAGNLGLRIEFAQARGQFRDLNIVLALCLLGLNPGAQRLGRGFFGFGVEAGVEYRDVDGEPGAEVVGWKGLSRSSY